MPKYNLKCPMCSVISEMVVPRIMVEGEDILEECDGCGRILSLVKVQNKGKIILKGCTLKGENG